MVARLPPLTRAAAGRPRTRGLDHGGASGPRRDVLRLPSQATCSAPLFNNELGYTANLTDSINQVLSHTTSTPPAGGRQPPPPPQAPSTALARILQQQAKEYRRAQQALHRDDLGAYQRAVERLGQLIQQAQRLTQAPPHPTTAQASSRR